MQPGQRRARTAHHGKRRRRIHHAQRFLGIRTWQVLEDHQWLTTHGRTAVCEGQHRRDGNSVLPDPPMLGQPLHEAVAGPPDQHLADQPTAWRLQHPGHMVSTTA